MDSAPKYRPKSRLAPSIHHDVLRKWNSTNSGFTAESFMYPVFIVEDDDGMEEISSMPGIYRFGINRLLTHLDELVKKQLKSILVFGVITSLPKDPIGTHANSTNNPIVRGIPKIKERFPDLLVACDVCLCPYTSHGHCGILHSNGEIDNSSSIDRIRDVAVTYASAGADIVAPSDMMDGRIGAIKQGLVLAGLHHVAILSYAAKFASNFYGPFRDAAKSAPSFGDRKCYQLPPGSTGLALRAIARDIEECADMIMVKPGLPYLDLISLSKKQFPNHPMFVYQVSGEFAMFYHAASAGALDLRKAVEEVITSFRRAGADCIITYFTPQLLEWIQTDSSISRNSV